MNTLRINRYGFLGGLFIFFALSMASVFSFYIGDMVARTGIGLSFFYLLVLIFRRLCDIGLNLIFSFVIAIIVTIISFVVLSSDGSVKSPTIVTLAYILIILIIILTSIPGTKGPNKNGPDSLVPSTPDPQPIASSQQSDQVTPQPITVSSILIFGPLWILFQRLFLKGTDGPNQYGPDPLAPADVQQPVTVVQAPTVEQQTPPTVPSTPTV
jgi:uncharacterized membrane protein YhaH (DUF805 family)